MRPGAQGLPIALDAHCLPLKAALHPAPSTHLQSPLVGEAPRVTQRLSSYHFCWGIGRVSLCTRSSRAVLVSPVCQLCCLLFFKVRPCENFFLVQFPWTGELDMGLEPFAPQRGDLHGHDILHTCGSLHVGWGCGI